MSRKRKNKQAVPEEILAEGSEGTPVHVQADESGTELHVSAEVVEVVEDAAPEPRAKKRKGRAPKADDAGEELHAADSLDHAIEADDAVAGDGSDGHDSADVIEAAPDGGEIDGGEIDGGEIDGGDAEQEIAAAGDDSAVGEELATEGDEVAAVMPTSAGSLDAKSLRHLVEALVFAADKPITVQRLRQLTRVADVGRLEAALAELAIDYQDRGVILQQVSGGYQFRTQTRFSAWVQQLIQGRPVRLSRAQLETLAIVAYRQPITRPEIDDIRGVDSSATLKLLLDRALIRILGKREEVGRPMLYGTTKEFLDFFSLGDLRELPTLREYSELTDESRKVMKDRLGGGEPEGGSTPPSDDGSEGGGAPPSDDGEGGGDSPASAMAAEPAETDLQETAEHAPDPTGESFADPAIDAPAEIADQVLHEATADEVPAIEVARDAESSSGAGDGRAWPHGSMRMAAVTPVIELEPKPEEPAVDAPVATVLEGVAPDSGGPIQE